MTSQTFVYPPEKVGFGMVTVVELVDSATAQY